MTSLSTLQYGWSLTSADAFAHLKLNFVGLCLMDQQKNVEMYDAEAAESGISLGKQQLFFLCNEVFISLHNFHLHYLNYLLGSREVYF